MGCPPLADGVIQLKKNPTEENRKQVLFFSWIPLDLIIYQMMMDSPQIKNATSAIPGISHRKNDRQEYSVKYDLFSAFHLLAPSRYLLIFFSILVPNRS